FGYLHLKTFVFIKAAGPANAVQPAETHGRGVALVRVKGFEPSRLSSREPKSRVSTNSTTPAFRGTFTLESAWFYITGGQRFKGKLPPNAAIFCPSPPPLPGSVK